MRIDTIRRGVTIAAIAIAASAALSACSVQTESGKEVPEGKVVVKIDGKESTYADGYAVTGTGTKVSIGVNNSSATLKCTGSEDVELIGDTGKVTITGTCGDVEAAGIDQDITFGKAQAVQILGSNNTVKAGAVDSLKVAGTGNRVTYTSSAAEVESLGVDNKVDKK